MKDEPRPVHEHEHATPTVIHHPEEDMTILGRWLARGLEQGARFWLWLGGAVAAVFALAFLASGLAAGKSAAGQGWIEVLPARTPEDQLKIAETFPKLPVADWTRLRAAIEEYDSGLIDLTTPGKKETAGPRLAKALKLFQQVAAEAPKDSSQAIGAALGVARTLEARNELPEAIKQYKLVAANWAGTPEARQAAELAKALEDPENVTFYKELYAYKPPAGAPSTSPLTLPPGGSESFDIKSLLKDFPSAPPGLDAPPPKAIEPPEPTTPAPAPAGLDAPPAKTPAPDVAPKPEEAKPAPAPATPKAEPPAESPAPPK